MDTIQKVENYIKQNSLLPDGSKIIVGVSGGSDSVALLDILCRLGYNCIVAHCNFHLRGEESYRDEYFVEKLATTYKLEYVCTHFDTKKYVKDGSMSIEMAARELRYAWFEKIRMQYSADYISVAHHLDDSVETVLLNLIRGTGIRGLTGIPNKNGLVVRPLLGITRKEILEYLAAKNLSFVEDSTNVEEICNRNKIRLSVLPFLETMNPSVKQAIYRTSINIQQVEGIYLTYIESAKKQIFKNNRIGIKTLLQMSEPKAILFEILSPLGFNSSIVDNIYDSINAQSGKIFYSDQYRLVKDRNYFILEELTIGQLQNEYTINEYDESISIPITLFLTSLPREELSIIEKNKNIAYLDKGKIHFPLTLRHWQQGDWFIPFGMKGKKKLSDYFIDKKYSIPQKENTWLLCSGNRILWIVGERADNRSCITNETKEILKIELK